MTTNPIVVINGTLLSDKEVETLKLALEHLCTTLHTLEQKPESKRNFNAKSNRHNAEQIYRFMYSSNQRQLKSAS